MNQLEKKIQKFKNSYQYQLSKAFHLCFEELMLEHFLFFEENMEIPFETLGDHAAT